MAETDQLYVPGQWRCAKCNFVLYQRTLNAADGTVSARDEPGEPCPNCKTPLRRVSWKEQAAELEERCIEQIKERRKVEEENDRLRELMKLAHAVMRQCGWQLAPASDYEGDGILESAAAEIEEKFTDILSENSQDGRKAGSNAE